MMTTDIQSVKNRKVLLKEINLTEKCMCIIVSSSSRLSQKTANDFHELYAMIQIGWPETKRQVPYNIREY